ncbi:BCL2L1 [Branchiostoma lanceolatum]|uniref:BCL2L1 protein n=2 Tax=Branchiostoma lanceolatum TaxID=7740 RepID=A0A8K0AID3_BRALA|nr:BCL2L1 [Branchiostoma lanceolatum]
MVGSTTQPHPILLTKTGEFYCSPPSSLLLARTGRKPKMSAASPQPLPTGLSPTSGCPGLSQLLGRQQKTVGLNEFGSLFHLGENNNKIQHGRQQVQSHSDAENPIVAEAEELARFYIQTKISNRKPTPPNKTAATLQRTADELLERHQYFFNGMVNRLQISPETSYTTFKNVADEMLKDQTVNWGRVVALYAFAGRIAVHCREQNPEVAETVGEFLGKYVGSNLEGWIKENGGWETLNNVFRKDQPVEVTLRNGLIFTAAALGAAATVLKLIS